MKGYKNMKKIVFNIVNIKNWMGGIYYAQNIINLFMRSDKLLQKYEVHLLTPHIHAHIFRKYEKNIKIVEMESGNYYLNSIKFIQYMKKNRIDYWYALSMNIIEKLLVKKAVFWIADFQYIHLPQFFAKWEWNMRHATSKYMAKKKNILILSSNDAKKDFEEYYPNHRSKSRVVHFASAIEDEILSISLKDEKKVLQEYGIEECQYVYIPNQFWQHKNHIIVLQMIKKFVKNNSTKVLFIFTGQMHDYRNKEYTNEIQQYFNDKEISGVTRNLGFLDRKEQLIIMKNACFLIQPSLFEGWGTVLEDAKVLDKRVVLSDLDVHKEQMYEKCILFKKNSSDDLLEKVNCFLEEEVNDSIAKGIERLYRDSEAYAKELEEALI